MGNRPDFETETIESSCCCFSSHPQNKPDHYRFSVSGHCRSLTRLLFLASRLVADYDKRCRMEQEEVTRCGAQRPKSKKLRSRQQRSPHSPIGGFAAFESVNKG